MSVVDRYRNANDSLQKVGETVGFYGAVAILVVVSFFPVIWILLTSLKVPSTISQFPVQYLPETVTLENYRRALEQAPFMTYLFNSFVVASATAIIDVILGAMAGYTLSRLEFRGKLPLLMFILISAMLPFIGRLIPLFTLFRSAGLLNTHLGLILPYAA